MNTTKIKYSGIDFAIEALGFIRTKRCFLYLTSFLNHVGEKLKESKLHVRMFNSMDQLPQILSMRGNTSFSTCIFIPQRYISFMEESKKINNRRGLIFIISCDDDSLSTMSIAKALNIPVWTAVRPSDIFIMIKEANVYSMECNTAVAVCVSRELFLFTEMLDKNRLEIIRREAEYDEIKSNLIIPHGTGAKVFLTTGNAAPLTIELLKNVKNTKVLEARALIFGRMKLPETYVEVMPKLGTIYPDERDIRKLIGRNLSFDQKMQMPPERKTTDEIREQGDNLRGDAAICGGCIFRIKICEYMDEREDENLAWAEEIYCSKKYRHVFTGITRRNAKHFDSLTELELYVEEKPGRRGIFFTNGNAKAREGIETIYLTEEGEVRIGKKVRVNKSKCNRCYKCVEKSGCPAFDIRDLIVKVSENLCTGCGLCIDYCKRNAIIRQ